MTRSKSSLSTARRKFVELLQTINFGHIENLHLRDGQPILEPLPTIVNEIKFCAENGPRSERSAPDFLLKAQVVELFEHFDRLGTSTIALIEVKHGLPFKMLVARAAA